MPDAALPNAITLRVEVVLLREDLEAIADRYADEHGHPPPPVTSRAFRAYCHDMVRRAVGSAGAGGWEEGVV